MKLRLNRVLLHSVRSEMLIDQEPTNLRLRSEERNATSMPSVMLSSAPPNGAATGIAGAVYIHVTPNGVRTRFPYLLYGVTEVVCASEHRVETPASVSFRQFEANTMRSRIRE